MRWVRETTFAVEYKAFYILLCVCARVGLCVRASAHSCAFGSPSAWAFACACAGVALLIQHTMRMRHILLFVASLAEPHFSILSRKRHDFW